MKVRVSSPLMTITADLTQEQVWAIFNQVLWSVKDNAGDRSEIPDTIPEPQEDQPSDDPEETPVEQPSEASVPAETTPILKQWHKGGFLGFLYIKCDVCGKKKGFYAKKLLTHYHCDCGHDTELRDIKRMYVKCPCCNNSLYYKTNIQDDRFEIDCLRCGAPVDMTINNNKTEYITLSSVKRM